MLDLQSLAVGPDRTDVNLSKRRHPCRLRVHYHFIRRPHEPAWVATTRNLSHGGVGLELTGPLQVGTQLALVLPCPNGSGGYRVGAHVVHASPLAAGQWLVGCRFLQPLDDRCLATLVAN